MKFIKPYFILVWEVWVLLIAGCVWVAGVNILSCDREFQAASGSVLVGFSVIAQLIFDNMSWRKQFEDPDIESVMVNSDGAINSMLKNGCVAVGFSFVVGNYRPSLAELYSNLLGLGQSRIKYLLAVGISDTDREGWCGNYPDSHFKNGASYGSKDAQNMGSPIRLYVSSIRKNVVPSKWAIRI